MLRGTIVRVNGNEYKSGRRMTRNPAHLIGKKGIALRRIKNSGYIQVLQEYQGFLVDSCYPESTLDVIEPPVEL